LVIKPSARVGTALPLNTEEERMMSFRLILSLGLMLLVSSHVLAAGPSETVFIEGDVQLEPHPDRKGAYRYIKPDVKLETYDRLAIDTIEVFLHEDSPYKGFQADDFKVITDTMRRALVDSLEPAYPVVDKAGPNTIVLKMAITGVKLKKKKRGLLGYTPIGAVVTATQDQVASRTVLLDASLEAEFYDSQSGDKIAVVVDQNLARDFKGDAESWDGMKQILGFYGERIKAALDTAHGK
jgi:hypothetical protein